MTSINHSKNNFVAHTLQIGSQKDNNTDVGNITFNLGRTSDCKGEIILAPYVVIVMLKPT
jgi:hypothetical protein